MAGPNIVMECAHNLAASCEFISVKLPAPLGFSDVGGVGCVVGSLEGGPKGCSGVGLSDVGGSEGALSGA